MPACPFAGLLQPREPPCQHGFILNKAAQVLSQLLGRGPRRCANPHSDTAFAYEGGSESKGHAVQRVTTIATVFELLRHWNC